MAADALHVHTETYCDGRNFSRCYEPLLSRCEYLIHDVVGTLCVHATSHRGSSNFCLTGRVPLRILTESQRLQENASRDDMDFVCAFTVLARTGRNMVDNPLSVSP